MNEVNRGESGSRYPGGEAGYLNIGIYWYLFVVLVAFNRLAERVGFEPTVTSRLHTLSRRAC